MPLGPRAVSAVLDDFIRVWSFLDTSREIFSGAVFRMTCSGSFSPISKEFPRILIRLNLLSPSLTYSMELLGILESAIFSINFVPFADAIDIRCAFMSATSSGRRFGGSQC